MGVMDSDISTQLLDLTRGSGDKGTLGSRKGKCGQAPASEAKDSDDPSTSLDEDAMETSETLAGTRILPPNRLMRRAGLAILTWPPRCIRKW